VVDDSHVVGEIGQVFAGTVEGRQSPEQLTIYKSLGHVSQDLAAAAYLHARATQQEIAP
jgi:ornithine cyclodeaminase